MFFDNIILFLNVLEQFAIRVSIFDFNVEDITKYVNNAYGFDFFDGFASVNYVTNTKQNIDSYIILKDNYYELDKKIENYNMIFKKLDYNFLNLNPIHFNYVY